MSQTKVECPGCNVILRFKGQRTEITCPRCQTKFEAANAVVPAAVEQPIPQVAPAQQPAQPIAQQIPAPAPVEAQLSSTEQVSQSLPQPTQPAAIQASLPDNDLFSPPGTTPAITNPAQQVPVEQPAEVAQQPSATVPTEATQPQTAPQPTTEVAESNNQVWTPPAPSGPPEKSNNRAMVVLAVVGVLFGLIGFAVAGAAVMYVYMDSGPSELPVAQSGTPLDTPSDSTNLPASDSSNIESNTPSASPKSNDNAGSNSNVDPAATDSITANENEDSNTDSNTNPTPKPDDTTVDDPVSPNTQRDNPTTNDRDEPNEGSSTPSPPDNINPPPQPRNDQPKVALKYGWKTGDEHIYAISISAEIADEKKEFTGSCAYKIGAMEQAGIAEVQTASGTGFVVGAGGYLMTCAHVIEDASEIKVTFGEKQFIAQVIDTDLEQDLALLHVADLNPTPLALANSSEVKLAQEIRAVGFPLSDVLGKGVKITKGTISGLIQEEDGKRFQIDAAINPGNSGGPVINNRGEVVGVASAKLMGIEVSKVGFAVPANQVQKILQRNGISPATSTTTSELAGPELAERITPSVAFIEVTIDKSKDSKYKVNYNGSFRESRSSSQSESGSLKISDNGEIDSYTGSKQLPFVLGHIGQFAIEDLDNQGQSRWGWEEQSSLNIIERTEPNNSRFPGDPFGRPFGPRIPRIPIPRDPFGGGRFPGDPFGRGNEKPKDKVKESYPAVERVRYRVEKEEGNLVTITKTYEFRTLEDSDNPYLVSKGTGTIVFDKLVGMPASFEYKGSITTHSKNATLRIPLTVSYRLRDPLEIAEERRKLAEAAAKAKEAHEKRVAEEKKLATIPDPEACRQLIDQIKASEGKAGHGTLEALAKRAVVPELQNEVVDLFKPYTKGSHFPQKAAMNGIAKWGGESHIPLLIEMLKTCPNGQKAWVMGNLIRSLGRFKKPEVVAAIAPYLGERSYGIDGAVNKALVAIGPTAEDAVLAKFQSSPSRGIAGILKQIGTSKSIAALDEAIAKARSSFDKRDYAAARDEIKKRIGTDAPAEVPVPTEGNNDATPPKPKLPGDNSRGAT